MENITKGQWFGGPSADLGDPINQSLRFNGTQALVRTATAAVTGDWTLSFWMKIDGPKRTAADGYLFMFGGYALTPFNLYMNNNKAGAVDTIGKIYDVTGGITLTGRYRDPAAWYHFVMKRASNVVTAWMNGAQVVTYSSASTMNVNNSELFSIGDGTYSSITAGFDGYMADWYFVDGQAKNATDFGRYNADGVWIPQTYTGTYGSQGFHLTFDSSQNANPLTGIGIDSSGNNNHFSSKGGTSNWGQFETAALSASNFDNDIDYEDTPTNNCATLNSLIRQPSNHTHYEANLYNIDSNGSVPDPDPATQILKGKKYWEVEIVTGSASYPYLGICRAENITTNTNWYASAGGGNAHYWHGAGYNGWVSNPASTIGSHSNGDVMGVAFDRDTLQCTFTRNGGTGQTVTAPAHDGEFVPMILNAVNQVARINFGQRPFRYTPPTGYTGLCTNNEPEPTIKNGRDHFDILTYTGDGNQTTTKSGLNFAPDLVWIKHRNGASTHSLQDTVRGAGTNALRPDVSDAEGSGSSQYGYISAFTSDGFTLNRGTNPGSRVNSDTSQTYVAWCWRAGATASKTYTVKVVSDSGNKYRFDDFGLSAVTLDLEEGGTYVFDQSDSSNSGHPLRFSTTSNGTHGGGSEYTTGVTTEGTPGSAGAKTTITVASGAPTLYYYCTAHSGMGGQANTNDTKGSSNFDGTIQAKVTANTDAGFSIVSYTGNATSGATIGHGLTQAPGFMIVRNRDDSEAFAVYQHKVNSGTTPQNYWMRLDNNNSKTVSSAHWNNTAPSNSVFTVGNSNATNGSAGHNDKMIAYCWHEVEGFSKFGSYIGNGNTDGQFIYTGFRPAFVLIKREDSASHSWTLLDTTREPENPCNLTLVPSESSAEDSAYERIDIVSNGFKNISTWAANNVNGSPYIYIAFAENPFGGENVAPATAR